MPAYRPDLTPTREMGTVAECFRSQGGVRRSRHPRVSFTAWGRHAEAEARLIPMWRLVDFGEHWIAEHRRHPLS